MGWRILSSFFANTYQGELEKNHVKELCGCEFRNVLMENVMLTLGHDKGDWIASCVSKCTKGRLLGNSSLLAPLQMNESYARAWLALTQLHFFLMDLAQDSILVTWLLMSFQILCMAPVIFMQWWNDFTMALEPICNLSNISSVGMFRFLDYSLSPFFYLLKLHRNFLKLLLEG